MSGGGVPEWFGKGDKPSKTGGRAAAEPEAPSGAPTAPAASPKNKPAVIAASVVCLVAAIGTYFVMQPKQVAPAETVTPNADGVRLHEAMRKAASKRAAEVPDPSELPSIEEVLVEDVDEPAVDDGDNADAAAASDGATTRNE